LGRSIVALRVMKEDIHIFGACTGVPITNENCYLVVKQAHLVYAVFLEKECKQALLEEEERKKSEQPKEAQRAAEKAKYDLTERLNEQKKLEESQLLEQDTARQLISEASKKLTQVLQDSRCKVQEMCNLQILACVTKNCSGCSDCSSALGEGVQQYNSNAKQTNTNSNATDPNCLVFNLSQSSKAIGVSGAVCDCVIVISPLQCVGAMGSAAGCMFNFNAPTKGTAAVFSHTKFNTFDAL